MFDGAQTAPSVFVDPKSLRLLDGIVLDYDTSLLSKGFVFNNPHATEHVRLRNVVQRAQELSAAGRES